MGLEDRYYLDTSAIVKRYVEEPGSRVIDQIYENAYKEKIVITFSYWNIAEAALVFDKYERRAGINARRIFKDMLRETRSLTKTNRAIIVYVSPRILRETVKIMFRHHVYVADALQLASARKIEAKIFVTGDKELANIAILEKLNSLYVK